MLLGACLAGIAIENSMLGATHALANPLTERFGTPHGVAIALLLPHVVRWNAETAGDLYGELTAASHRPGAEDRPLADGLGDLAATAGLPQHLEAAGVPRGELPALARASLEQWTGRFNPRPLTEEAALALYEAAY
jgi:alcohol dehydrogenase